MDLVRRLEETRPSAVLLEHQHRRLQPGTGRLRRALASDELFTVAVDLFRTDTVDCADVVLPAASFLEHDDLVVSYSHQDDRAGQGGRRPGQALPNSEIFRRLASTMGLDEPELHETDGEILGAVLRAIGNRLDFADVRQSWGPCGPSAERGLQFEELQFATASGRIELACRRPRLTASPACAQAGRRARGPAGGRLRLLSPVVGVVPQQRLTATTAVSAAAPAPMVVTLQPVRTATA